MANTYTRFDWIQNRIERLKDNGGYSHETIMLLDVIGDVVQELRQAAIECLK